MNKPERNVDVDTYIGKAAPFAQPILTHLRGLVHKACPGVVEEMKWSRPFFLHDSVILANMSAFKQHCSFGFWGAEMGKVLQDDGVLQDGGMGSLGRITSVQDLPAEKTMLQYLRQAATFIDEGRGETFVTAGRRVAKAPKTVIEPPPEFAAALHKNKTAAKVFEAFSPSCKREYVEWIAEAKREETRNKRIAEAIDWIAQGKQRNWKYQDC